MRIDNVCKGCTERHLGCHQECELYNNAKDKYEKQKENIKEQKRKESALNSYERERVVKALRKNGVKA